MNKFSDKQMILILLFTIFILSTTLMYLMIDKDLQVQNKSVQREENYSIQEITNMPRVEIETSK